MPWCVATRNPQRRPPHEGEASVLDLWAGQARATPQRRPPHEGEARRETGANELDRCPLNEGLPTKGRRAREQAGRTACMHPSTKASPRRGGERSRRPSTASWGSPQRRPPHEGEARCPAPRGRGPRWPSLNEGLPTKGRRGDAFGRVVAGLNIPQRRPPHEGEASTLMRGVGAVFTWLPQRRPPHEGEARWFVASDLAKILGPQRRPPHEGEASVGVDAPRPHDGPSTKASPRRGGEARTSSPVISDAMTLNEGLPTKGRRDQVAVPGTDLTAPLNEGLPTKGRRASVEKLQGDLADPQRRPPHEGEARTSFSMVRTISSSLNEGLPTKGRRDQGHPRPPGQPLPSTKASPRRGGEGSNLAKSGLYSGPQRRPPHEGEARRTPVMVSSGPGCPSTKASPRRGGEPSYRLAGVPACRPQRRPPHEGEARVPMARPPGPQKTLNEGLPTKGRRGGSCR